MVTLMKTSTKRISMGKSGSTTAHVGGQRQNLTTQFICAQMLAQKQLYSPCCCVLSRQFPEGVYPLGEQPNQAR